MDPITRMRNISNQEGASGIARALSSYTMAQIDRGYQAIISPIAMKGAIRAFKEESNNILVSDYLVSFAYRFSYLGINIRPDQIHSEITELCKIIKQRKVTTILEIGRAGGGTLFLFCKSAANNAYIMSIDMPVSTLEKWNMNNRKKLYYSFKKDKQHLFLIDTDSHSNEVWNTVNIWLSGRSDLDFLFIDGDHSYMGVKTDYALYAGLVKKGGIIAFHDIAENKGHRQNPVRDFWLEVRKNHKYKEICHSKGKGYGIGILYM